MSTPKASQKIRLEKLRKIDPKLEIRWDEKTGTPSRLRGRLSEPRKGEPEAIARKFLEANKELFDLDNEKKELILKRIKMDSLGMKHVWLFQEYKGIPVFGGELIVHIDQDNSIKGINGRYFPRIDIETKPKIQSKKAISIALKHAKEKEQTPKIPPKLEIFPFKEKYYLAWHVTFEGKDMWLDKQEIPATWEYFINAIDGRVIYRYNSLAFHQATTGTGKGRYSGLNVTLNTFHDHAQNTYLLRDTTRTGAEIITHDLGGSVNGGLVNLSADQNNDWSKRQRNPRTASQEPAVDAHFYSGIIHDYYLNVHGRNSWDNQGSNMDIKVHYGINENNAFWSGLHSAVLLGDGDNGDGVPPDFDYQSPLDVIAHEWTHSVAHEETGLSYASPEPGALYEHISDVFACFITEDWLYGEECFLQDTAPASRNLADPTNGGQYDTTNPAGSVLDGHQPDHYNDRYTGTWDYGGVHVNSGILNKAAYLMVNGGTHRGINICGALGKSIAERIYYRALTTYLNSNSDFVDARDALLDACDDLYGIDALKRAVITNAFAAVGIGNAVLCPTVVVQICPRYETLLPFDAERYARELQELCGKYEIRLCQFYEPACTTRGCGPLTLIGAELDESRRIFERNLDLVRESLRELRIRRGRHFKRLTRSMR